MADGSAVRPSPGVSPQRPRTESEGMGPAIRVGIPSANAPMEGTVSRGPLHQLPSNSLRCGAGRDPPPPHRPSVLSSVPVRPLITTATGPCVTGWVTPTQASPLHVSHATTGGPPFSRGGGMATHGPGGVCPHRSTGSAAAVPCAPRPSPSPVCSCVCVRPRVPLAAAPPPRARASDTPPRVAGVAGGAPPPRAPPRRPHCHPDDLSHRHPHQRGRSAFEIPEKCVDVSSRPHRS